MRKPFRPADVAEPIGVLIWHDFAYELRAALRSLPGALCV
jgi:hypothetical protein